MKTATVLDDHAEQCEECRATPLPLAGIGALLSTMEVPIQAPVLSTRAMDRLLQEVALVAPAAWRRMLVAMLTSLLPLPLVLAVDAYVLRALYTLGNLFLPTVVTEYVVVSYGAFLVLAFALTYAAVPLLLLRQRAGVIGWGAFTRRSLA